MTKTITKFFCQSCGAMASKWGGKCDACHEWNTLVEEKVSKVVAKKGRKSEGVQAQKICDIDIHNHEDYRLKSQINEFDRVCGGGLVPGSVVLIGGDPGIGKSTLLLQVTSILSGKHTCAYVSGEEAPAQIKMRGERLNLHQKDYWLLCDTNLNSILDELYRMNDLQVVVMDSIQTMALQEIESSAGSVSQVKGCTQELIKFAKKKNVIVILVGHVTKEGALAGPRVLEHMVDTVLYFEGERNYDYRLLRSIKNRFGPTNEIGIFSMCEKGLEEVTNPSALFLPHHKGQVTGTSIFAGLEGTRPLLCEIQALVAPSYLAAPRRNVVGWDQNRLSMILAVLETRCGLGLGSKDVFLNVAGGLKITEPGCDLAVAAALISAFKNEPTPKSTVYFGEIGLSGEVRATAHAEQRIKEAQKLGFSSVCTAGSLKDIKTDLEIVRIYNLLELI
ncbi:MAG TPA: DNA repair protein RadA [Holosporales bacterium]|nr:DNA repair protein RadA [Holosporales bacterium]